jgi:asparagine synthase (glutamine-hydrolysing)
MTFLGFADSSGKAPPRPLEAPVLHVEGPLTVAFQGGPVALDGKPLPAPGEALAAAYRQRGPSFLSGLTGPFALVVVDKAAGRVLLALDRMGIERLTYARLGEGLVFSSSAEAVSRYPGMTASLRTQAIFDYLMLHMVPAPDTIYRGVYKLRPGTCAILDKGTLRIERYWVPRFEMGGGGNFQSLRDELHEALRAAVTDCEPHERTGAFLSGGLDSSTVVGVLSKVAARPVRSFSMGFGVQEFNEIEYARIANRRFGAQGTEYDVTADDVVDAFGKIAAAYDEPFGNSSAIPTYYCAKVAAEHGMTHLLAGDGGDEIFAGNERYAKQKIFEAWWRLPMGLR